MAVTVDPEVWQGLPQTKSFCGLRHTGQCHFQDSNIFVERKDTIGAETREGVGGDMGGFFCLDK